MVVSLLSEYIYIVLCILTMKYMWQKEIQEKNYKYVTVALVIIASIWVEKVLKIEGIIIYPIEIVCIIFMLKGDKIINFVHFLITDMFLALFQRILAYFAILLGKVTYSDILKSGNEKLVLRLSTLFLLILLKDKLKRYSNYLKKLTWYHMLSCVLIEVCLIFIIAQAELGMFFNAKKVANSITMGLIIVLCLFILSTIVVFIIVDINRKHYQEQNRLKDKYLTIQEKYYKTIIDKNEEVIKIRHDLKAHLGCMEILLEKEDYDEAGRYIKELKNDTIKRIDTAFKSGNSVIDAVLNDISDIAYKHGVRIEFVGILPKSVKIKSTELCSLFYNLLSNSEEAVNNYKGGLPRVIQVEVTSYKRNVGIVVKNPIEKPIEISRLGKYTTKEDKRLHGYGIENVRTIVDKYNGVLEYENIDGYLVCKVTFLDIING